MNVALKLTAAVALAVSMANASAGATGPASADGLPGNGLGNGTGDLIFAYEGSGGVSILWDLVNPAGGARSDLTFNDILTSPSFTISNAAVSSFVSANPGGRWNIFGLTNVRNPNFGASGSTLRYSQAGAAVTVNGQPNVGFNGANAEGAIDLLAQWVSNANSGGLNASDTLTATPTDSWTFSAGGGIHSANLVGQNSSAGLNSTLGFYSLLIDTTKNRGLSAGPTNALGTLLTQTELGSFTFSFNDASGVASLAYAPIPVPPALVLFGSALAGIAGLRRRRAA